MPFNVPIEFVGEPKYGEHEIKIIVRYKDDLRDEQFETLETSIFVEDKSDSSDSQDFSQLFIIPVVAAIAVGVYVFRRKKQKVEQ